MRAGSGGARERRRRAEMRALESARRAALALGDLAPAAGVAARHLAPVRRFVALGDEREHAPGMRQRACGQSRQAGEGSGGHRGNYWASPGLWRFDSRDFVCHNVSLCK